MARFTEQEIEEIASSYRLAGFPSRIAAIVIDLAVAIAIASLVITPLGGAVFSWLPGFLEALLGLILLVAFLVAYFVALPLRLRGRTLGKFLFSLQVVRLDGRPLDFKTEMLRFSLALLIPAIAALYIPFAWIASLLYLIADYAFPFFNPARQALHDRVAQTLVVKKEKRSPSAKEEEQEEAPDFDAEDEAPGFDEPESYEEEESIERGWHQDPDDPERLRYHDGDRWTGAFAGWVDDPDNPGQQRYWNGQSFTQSRSKP